MIFNKKSVFCLVCLYLMVNMFSLGDDTSIHTVWDNVLTTHVKNGFVNYKAILRDHKKIDKYLESIATVDLSGFSREEKLAFWINAYNAFTIKLILNNYPVKSIRNIKKPWKQKIWLATGEKVSLDEIENIKLRKELKEPRIHFAIVCASIGCPNLWNHAYSEKKIDEDLDAATRRFMRSKKHVQMVTKSRMMGGTQKILYVNKIMNWFSEDFTNNGKRRIQDFIIQYADKSLIDFISSAGKTLKIKYLYYDWALNKTP